MTKKSVSYTHLSLTACGVKQASTTDSKNTQTEAGSEVSGKSDSRLDDLYQDVYKRQVYSLSHKKLMELANDAGAIYRMDGIVLINREIFDEYLEQFHEK